MRVLHVITNLSPAYGGPVKACKEMCASLADAGEDVTIYTTNLDYPVGRLDVPLNKRIHHDGYNVWYFPIQFSPYVVSWGLARALKENINKFDLVHIHGLYRFPQAAAAYFSRKYKVPYLIRPHGSLDPFLFNHKRHRVSKRLYEHLIENKNLNAASALHFTTSEEMQLVQSLRLSAPGVVIPNGLDSDKYDDLPPFGRFRKKHKIGDAKIILHFGRINFIKGIDILVKAFAEVSRTRDDVFLVIAGPDNEGYRSQVESWLTEENVTSKIIFTGMLQGDDALEVLRDADIFALPSYAENFGIAVIEAMASGLPVVISDKVNIWREVRDAGAGLVTSCNETEVAEAFIKLLDDNKKRGKLGNAGKILVREKYGWDEIVQELRATYKNILANSHDRH